MKKTPYKTKYIHFLFTDEWKFTSRLIALINEEENGLSPKDHLFITPFENVYEALKQYDNVVLDNVKGNLFNRYKDSCDWMISHSLISKKHLLFTTKKTRKKIIYRYWGNSVTTCLVPDPRKPIRYVIDKIKIWLFNQLYSSFAAVAVANTIDILDISRILKNGRYIKMSYASRESCLALQEIKAKGNKRNDGYINILLGHRGSADNNHIVLLNVLKKYENEKIRIYIPLSYGYDDYIEKMKSYIDENRPKNVIVVDKMMDYRSYMEFLNDIDIGIFDGTASYALGNIAAMLFFRKTIYLNRNGIIKKAFDYEKVPHRFVDEIENLSFQEFIAPIDYSNAEDNELQSQTLETYISRWKKIMEEFN